MKILMVCLGNICRSPMAEGIMRNMIYQHKLDWTVDSCGTGGWHAGEAPDLRAQKTAGKFGVNISDLKARQFTVNDFDAFDKIYAMDLSNYENVRKKARDSEDIDKVFLLLEILHNPKETEVEDPWYDDKLFVPVFKQIEKACALILQSNLDSLK